MPLSPLKIVNPWSSPRPFRGMSLGRDLVVIPRGPKGSKGFEWWLSGKGERLEIWGSCFLIF